MNRRGFLAALVSGALAPFAKSEPPPQPTLYLIRKVRRTGQILEVWDMAIVVREMFGGRDGTISAGGKGNEGITREWAREFQVYLDSSSQGAIHVVTATGIPRIGDPYVCGGEIDLASRCYTVKPKSHESEPRLWMLSAEYSSDPSKFGDPNKEVPGGAPNEPGQKDGKPGDPNNPQSKDNDDPLQQPAQIEWGEGSYSEVVYKATLVVAAGDIPDMAVCNSAGEPFDPPLEVTKTFLTLKVQRNQSSFDPKKASGFKSARNSDKFFGFDPGQVKCKSITASQEFKKGTSFWRVSYLFEIRDSWDYDLLDAGYWSVDGDGKRQPITYPNGRPLQGPWPLDGAGGALTPDQVRAGSVFYRKFRLTDQKGFGALSLP